MPQGTVDESRDDSNRMIQWRERLQIHRRGTDLEGSVVWRWQWWEKESLRDQASVMQSLSVSTAMFLLKR